MERGKPRGRALRSKTFPPLPPIPSLHLNLLQTLRGKELIRDKAENRDDRPEQRDIGTVGMPGLKRGINADKFLAEPVEPVSYTHLDVYKRQVLDFLFDFMKNLCVKNT